MFFVGTGTAANALALTLANKPGGVGFCHREAHAIEDECGAPEYFTGGARLARSTALGPHGPGQAGARDRPLSAGNRPCRPAGGGVHHPVDRDRHGLQPRRDRRDFGDRAQGTDCRCTWTARASPTRWSALGTTPAEMTWKRGVDTLSFGGTKNGCWCAEAIVLFDRSKAAEMAFIRKRAAQLFSKSRFIAAQFDAYFDDGLWLETARHANALAARLAGHIRASRQIRACLGARRQRGLRGHDEAGERDRLLKKGAVFFDWHTPHDGAGELAPRTKSSAASSPALPQRQGCRSLSAN